MRVENRAMWGEMHALATVESGDFNLLLVAAWQPVSRPRFLRIRGSTWSVRCGLILHFVKSGLVVLAHSEQRPLRD